MRLSTPSRRNRVLPRAPRRNRVWPSAIACRENRRGPPVKPGGPRALSGFLALVFRDFFEVGIDHVFARTGGRRGSTVTRSSGRRLLRSLVHRLAELHGSLQQGLA